MLVLAALAGSAMPGCGDPAQPPILTEDNADATARAAAAAVSEAFHAARLAELIREQTPRYVPPHDGMSITSVGGPLVPIVFVSPFDDEACFTSGYVDGHEWFALDDCRYGGCWADGLVWEDETIDPMSQRRGFVYEDVLVDCGGAPEVDLSGLSAACFVYGDLRCRVGASETRRGDTLVRHRGVLEFVDPDDPPTEPYGFRHSVEGMLALPELSDLRFDTVVYPLRYDDCPSMMPSSGILSVRDELGAELSVGFLDCSHYRACLDRAGATHCTTGLW